MVNEGNLEESLLAPLDFDMSFEERTFVSTVDELPDKYGTRDREQFDSWMNSERYELESALGGEENMANFMYQEEEEEQVLRWIPLSELDAFVANTSQVKPKQHGPSY